MINNQTIDVFYPKADRADIALKVQTGYSVQTMLSFIFNTAIDIISIILFLFVSTIIMIGLIDLMVIVAFMLHWLDKESFSYAALNSTRADILYYIWSY